MLSVLLSGTVIGFSGDPRLPGAGLTAPALARLSRATRVKAATVPAALFPLSLSASAAPRSCTTEREEQSVATASLTTVTVGTQLDSTAQANLTLWIMSPANWLLSAVPATAGAT